MTRLRQAAVVAVGVVLAAVMVLLGLWQLDVYHEQGRRSADRRAAAPAVPLGSVAPAGAPVRDGYGRAVTFTGHYEPALQLLVPVAGQPSRFRVLTGLRQPDGSVVPVVRGLVVGGSSPIPPPGSLDQTGVLLPSEDDADRTSLPAGQLAAVRLPALAQTWPGPLINGYVTLSASGAAAQQLDVAVPDLPEGRGRLQNGAYAIQWWVFAAFALGMAVRIARDLGLRDAVLAAGEPAETSEAAPSSATAAPTDAA